MWFVSKFLPSREAITGVYIDYTSISKGCLCQQPALGMQKCATCFQNYDLLPPSFQIYKVKTKKKYIWFFIQDTVGRCASYLPPRLQVRVWFSNILILFYYSFFIWMCAWKNSFRDHCIFKKKIILICNKMKCFTLTELTGYAFLMHTQWVL